MCRRSSPGVHLVSPRAAGRVLRAAALLAAVGLLAPPARGGDYYWTGDNASTPTLWNATAGLGGTNWSSSPDFNNGTSGLPGAADNVFFYFNPSNLNTQLGQDFSVRSLNFTSDATSTVTIGGANTLTLGVGGLNVAQNSAAHIINTQVALGTAQTWTNNSTSALTVNGVISGANNLSLAGIGGNGGFVFTAANTYTGSTTLATAGASLTLGGANGSILNTSAITLNGGSVLTLDNTAVNNNNRIAATLGITSNGGSFNLTGNGGTPTAQTVGTLTLGSGLTNVTVTDLGAGATLTFGSASIPSFSRTTAGGAVNFSPTGTVAAPNVTLTNGIIGGWATIGNVNSTSGTNVLDFATVTGGTVAAYSGYVSTNTPADFTVAANNVKVSAQVTLGSATQTINSLYLTGQAQLNFGTGTAGTSQSTNTLIITSGAIISNAGTRTIGWNNQADTPNATFIGSVNNTGAATGNNGTQNYQGIITSGNGRDLIVTTASNLQIDSIIADNGATSIGLTKNGSGMLDLSAGNKQNQPGNGSPSVTEIANTFTGPVTINGGVLLTNDDQNLGKVPTVSTPAAIVLNGGDLRTTRGYTLAPTRGITVGPQGGTLSYNGGGTWNIGQNVAGTAKITGPGSLTISAIPDGFSHANSDTITLNYVAGTNDYQGATVLNTVKASAGATANITWNVDEQIPNGSAVTLTGNPGTGATGVNFNSKTETIGSLAGADPTSIIRGLGAFTTGQNNLSTTYAGSIAGTGSFTKVGTGIQTLTGATTYTGATNIGNASLDGGALMVNGTMTGTSQVNVGFGTTHSGTLGGSGTITSNVVVNALGHLSPSPGTTGTSTLTINGTLTVNGGATFDYNFGSAGSPGVSDLVNVTGTGNVTLNAGADVLNVTALSGFGIGTYNLITAAGTLTNNATFTVNGSNAFTYAVSTSGNSLILTVTAGNPTLTWIGNVNTAWQVGGPANWNNGSGPTAFANNNNVVFDDNGSTLTVAVDAAGVAANSVLVANSAGTYTIGGGAVTVATSLIKNQAGNVTFNNALSTQTTAIGGGKLTVGAAGTYNSAVKVDVTAGTLEVLGNLTTPVVNVLTAGTLTGTGTVTGNATLTGSGVINLTGAGTITGTLQATGGTWAGSATVGGLVTVGSGTFTLAPGVTLTAPAGVTIAGGTLAAGSTTSKITGSVTYTNPTSGSFTGVIAGAGSGVTMNATGATFTLSDLNTYGGPTTVTAGVLSVTSIADGGATSGIGASTSAAANLVLDGGTLRYAGPTASTNRNFTITAGKTGTLDVTNALTISGASAATTGALTKVGAGTLTLTGGNLHSGGTTVSAGTLLANNSGGSATGTGAVTVAAAATLGGTGFVVPDTGSVSTNTVTIAGTVSPGVTIGTLTLGSAAANATASLTGAYKFELTGLGTSVDPSVPANLGGSSATAVQDLLAVNGSLALAGSTVNISAASSGFTGSPSYSWQIATTTAGVSGTPTLGTITGDFAAYSNGFSLATDANKLYLNYVAPFYWIGNTSAAWATGANWLPGVPPGSGKTAIFLNPSPNTTVDLGGQARPVGGLKFDTAAAPAYTIGSTAGDALVFDANAAVTVTGTVTTAQTVAAAVRVLGPLTVSNAGTGGLTFTGPLSLASGGAAGTLTFTGTGATTYSGNIAAGSVSGVVVSGPGAVTLSGANAFAGGVTLNAGTLNVNSPTALGTGTFTIAGGTVNNTSAAAVTLTPNNPVALTAGFTSGGTQPLNLGTGAVTQSADATVTVTGANGITFGGNVTGGMSITRAGAGAGAVAFTGANVAFNNVTGGGGGDLVIGQAGGTTAIAGNVANAGGGAVVLNGTTTVSGATGVTNSGTGSVVLNGATTITGALAISGGTVNQPNPNTYQFTVTGGTLQIGPGAAVTATGLSLGSTGSTSGQILLANGSSLTVNSTANINIGNNSGSTTNPVGAILSGTGSAAVSLTAPAIVIGVGGQNTGQRSNALVSLGTGDNVLVANTAAGIAIGNSSNGGQDGDYTRSNNLGQAMLVLGKGNNTLTTPNLYVSGTKAPGSLFLGNGPVDMTANGNATSPLTTTTYAPPVPFLKPDRSGYAQVTVGDAGGGKTTMIVGYQNVANSGTNSVGVFDTTGGILNGTFGTVTLGFSLGNTTTTDRQHSGGVGSWVLGVANNSVTVDKVLLTNTASALAGITAGVFSLNGGTVTFNAGGGGFAYGNTASFTNTNVNLNGGTLDLNGNPILDPAFSPLPLDSFMFNGGTLKNATAVYVTGGLTQNGGTLLRDQPGTTTIGTPATAGTDVYTVSGGATVRLDSGGTNTVAVSAGSLARQGTGTLEVVPVTGNLDAAAAPAELLQFTASPPLPVSGEPILPAWIVVRTNGTATASADFAVFNASPNQSVGRFNGYATGNLNAALSTDIAAVSTATALSSSPTVYALKLSNAITDAGTHTLTIGALGSPAGLILDGGSIAANSLVFADEAAIYTTAQNGTITSPITVNGSGGLTTFGPGRLTLASPTANNVGAVTVNNGTLFLTGPTTATGAVTVKNGGTLSGTGSVTLSGSNGVAFGPGARFAPGNGSSFGFFSITTGTGNVTTATATTNPTNLTSTGLTFGMGISPTNVVGSAVSLTLGTPVATGVPNSGLSNANTVGSLATGFKVTSSGGTFILDPITTVSVSANPAGFAPGTSYSYLIGTVPALSTGGVTNLGNFDFHNGASSFTSSVSAASFLVSGGNVYLNFTTAGAPVPEPVTTGLWVAAGLGAAGLVRRRRRTPTA